MGRAVIGDEWHDGTTGKFLNWRSYVCAAEQSKMSNVFFFRLHNLRRAEARREQQTKTVQRRGKTNIFQWAHLKSCNSLFCFIIIINDSFSSEVFASQTKFLDHHPFFVCFCVCVQR